MLTRLLRQKYLGRQFRLSVSCFHFPTELRGNINSPRPVSGHFVDFFIRFHLYCLQLGCHRIHACLGLTLLSHNSIRFRPSPLQLESSIAGMLYKTYASANSRPKAVRASVQYISALYFEQRDFSVLYA